MAGEPRRGIVGVPNQCSGLQRATFVHIGWRCALDRWLASAEWRKGVRPPMPRGTLADGQLACQEFIRWRSVVAQVLIRTASAKQVEIFAAARGLPSAARTLPRAAGRWRLTAKHRMGWAALRCL